MANTNPLDATFFALKNYGRTGVLLSTAIATAVLMLVAGIALTLIMVVLMGPTLQAMASWSPQSAGAGLPAGFGSFMLFYVVFLFVYFVITAMYEAACLRWMIRRERAGLFGLSLNADTWRVYGAYWGWFFLLIGGYIATVAVMFGFIGALRDQPAIVGISVLILIPVVIGLWIFFTVRLAPAAATSIALGKFQFFSAWTVSRGRFWALFGAFLLLFIFLFVFLCAHTLFVYNVIYGAAGGISALISDPTEFSRAQTEASISMWSSPLGALTLIGVQILAICGIVTFQIMTFGVNARAALAAIEDGKIEGVLPDLAKTFE